MKAMIDKNRTSRILTTVLILAITVSLSYSQGLLAEGASRVLKSITKQEAKSETLYTLAKLSDDNVALYNVYNDQSSTAVFKSFKVNSIDIVYEKELTTEAWMNESFSESLEESVELENWMTTPLYESIEESLEVEEWMTVSLYDQISASEEELEVEEWMTTLFTK